MVYLVITRISTTFLKSDFDLEVFKKATPDWFLASSIALIFVVGNWFFEILKWKTVVELHKPISVTEAAKQSLYALTISLATPNRIGDYGAKALFYKPEHRKQIMLSNFFTGFLQMVVTLVLGITGLFFMVKNYDLPISIQKIIIGVTLVSVVFYIGYLFKKKQLFIKGLTIENVLKKIVEYPKEIWFKTIVFSLIRYMLFSTLFYLVLLFFGVTISVNEGFIIIFSVYLVASVLPTFLIFDVVVRGGVAIWLFGFAGVSELAVALSVLTMWLLNFAVPAIIGAYFMFTYKPLGNLNIQNQVS